jgi:hypothetical protein
VKRWIEPILASLLGVGMIVFIWIIFFVVQRERYISGTRELSGVIEKTTIKRLAAVMRKRQKEVRFHVWWIEPSKDDPYVVDEPFDTSSSLGGE